MKKALAAVIGIAVLAALIIVLLPQQSEDSEAVSPAPATPQKTVPLPPKPDAPKPSVAKNVLPVEDTGTFPSAQRPLVAEDYKEGELLRTELPADFKKHCPALEADLKSASWNSVWMQKFIRSEMGRYMDVARVLEPVFVCEAFQSRSPNGCLPLKDIHPELFNECIDEWQLAEYLARRGGIVKDDPKGIIAALAKENARFGRTDTFLVKYIPAILKVAADGTAEGCAKSSDDGVRLACMALVKSDASYCQQLPTARAKYYCAFSMDTAAHGNDKTWDAAAVHPEWSLPLRNMLKYFDLQPGKEQLPACNQGALDWLDKLCTSGLPY